MSSKTYQTAKGKIPIIQHFSNSQKNGIHNKKMPDSKLCVLRMPDGTIHQQWVRSSNIVEVAEKPPADLLVNKHQKG